MNWLRNFGSIVAFLLSISAKYLFVIIFLASLIEYVFPPFPGDTITLGAAYISGAYHVDIVITFIGCMLGSIAGAAFDYFVGSRLIGLWKIQPDKLESVKIHLKKKGLLLILFNRFFPGIRALILVAAGVIDFGFIKTIFAATLSAFLWNVLLFGMGWYIGKNQGLLLKLFRTYTTISLILGGIIISIFIYVIYKKISNEE